MVISTLSGSISNYKYSYLPTTLVTKSHDPLSRGFLGARRLKVWEGLKV